MSNVNVRNFPFHGVYDMDIGHVYVCEACAKEIRAYHADSCKVLLFQHTLIVHLVAHMMRCCVFVYKHTNMSKESGQCYSFG